MTFNSSLLNNSNLISPKTLFITLPSLFTFSFFSPATYAESPSLPLVVAAQEMREVSRPQPGEVAVTQADPQKTVFERAVSDKPGLEIGDFLLQPEIGVGEMYDDNIFATRANETEDWITIITPSVHLKSNWTRHSFNLWAGAEKNIYRSNSSENVLDHWLEAQGRYDLSGSTNVYAGAGIHRSHEDRSSLDDPTRRSLSAEPTRYWSKTAHLGGFHRFDRISLRLGGTYEHLDYDNVDSLAGGTILMDDRDRRLTSLGGRGTFKLTDRLDLFAQAATDNRRYDKDFADRDSDGYRYAVGLGVDLGGNNKGEIYFGHMRQDYDNPGLADVSKPYFGAEGKFAVGPTTYLSTFVEREIAETTVNAASSSIDTTIGARVDYDMSPDLAFNARLGYTRSQFQGIDRNEDFVDAGFGVRHYIAQEIYIAGDYRLMLRESDVRTEVASGTQNTFDYSRNQIFISIGYTPGRKPVMAQGMSGPGVFLAPEIADALGIALATPSSGYSGFYGGAQIGQGTLSTEIFSERSDGGSELMEMAGDGRSAVGVFLGYGWMWDRWYLGLEVDANNRSDEWFHSKDKPGARTMALEGAAAWGGGVRLGYALPGGLVYGSLGLVRREFDIYDTENQFATTGAYDRSKSLTGTRFGMGMEMPIQESLFIRMDYTYTNYRDFDASTQANIAGTDTTLDSFDIRENLLQLGVGWRWGEHQVLPVIDPETVAGFHAGVKAGYGVLSSHIDAIHNDGGSQPCTNCSFVGDFGDSGTTAGFFAGYGITLKRFYVGLEVEATSGKETEWKTDRDSGGGGRIFGVSKKGGHAASVKLGYVLPSGTLLYARLGQVRTRFTTIHEKGNSNNWVDRDDRLSGDLWAVGAEMPVYRNLFVKMDYSQTDYDDFEFVTSHGNPDTSRYNHRESLFSVGIGLRF